MNCQRLHVRFVVQPARLSQPSVTPISSRDAQDHRGRSHRPCVLIVPNWPSQSWWPLVLWLIVRWALVYLPPKFCVLPCTRHKTDPFCHLRSQHHPTHCSGVQRHARVEVWHKGFTDAVFCHLPPSFPCMRNATHLLAAGRGANTWLGYAGKLKRWEDFCACAGVRPFRAHPSHVLCYLGYLQEETLSKPAAYSSIFLPSTPGTQTWAFPNRRLAKQSTCSVEGTVRCKETRMTRLCWLGDLFQPTSCVTSSRWRTRHLRRPFAGLRPPASSATPLCFAWIRVFVSCIATSPSQHRACHYIFMSRPAGATSLPRYIDLATTRSTSSSAIGYACAAPLAKLRYGRFQTDITTPSHRRTSTSGFKRPVTSWASVPPKVRSGWDIRIALAATPPHFPSTTAFPPSLVLGCGIIWVASKHTWMPPSGRLLTPSSSSSTSSSQASLLSAISSQHIAHNLRGYHTHIAVFCSALLDWSFALLSPRPPQQIWPDYYRNPCICNRWPLSSARGSGARVPHPPPHRSSYSSPGHTLLSAPLACRSYLLCSSARGRPPTIAFRDL
jgi:hypothetical protein